MKTVANMSSNLGRIRRFSVVAFTGNKDGLCGFAAAKSPEGRGAIRKAKNRAGQKLIWIERYNNHTGEVHCAFCNDDCFNDVLLVFRSASRFFYTIRTYQNIRIQETRRVRSCLPQGNPNNV